VFSLPDLTVHVREIDCQNWLPGSGEGQFENAYYISLFMFDIYNISLFFSVFKALHHRYQNRELRARESTFIEVNMQLTDAYLVLN